MIPSKYQTAIYDWIGSGSGHAVVEAVAGSGKTTTILEGLDKMKGRTLFCAFNAHIAKELALRAPFSAQVRTIHSLGYAAVRKALKKVDVDADKLRRIVTDEMGNDFDDRTARIATENLVRIAKLTLTDPADRDALEALVDHYGIDTNASHDWILDTVPDVMTRCKEEVATVDFDDQVWLPTVLDLPVERFDWVCVDESQDLGHAQRELVGKAVAGRFVAVGDKNQAIYGFAGADTSSIQRITEKFSATSLPLSICYRCPASHVRLAKEIVPQIEARDNAPEGVIRDDATFDDIAAYAADGNLVICRINAPLVSIALSLIRAGKKAVLRGRDIGSNLAALVKRQKGCGDSINLLMEKLTAYRDREMTRLEKAGKTGQAENLKDRVETVIALSDGLMSIGNLEHRIQTIFSDSVQGIVCSSVHRAKGLEADRVMVYRPELMPHPRATQDWEVQQEHNLKYVSLTRAKKELWLVSK